MENYYFRFKKPNRQLKINIFGVVYALEIVPAFVFSGKKI